MQSISPYELERQSGGRGLIVKQFTDNLCLYSGIDNVGNLVAQGKITPPPAGLCAAKRGYEIRFSYLGEKRYAFIDYNDIVTMKYTDIKAPHRTAGLAHSKAMVNGLTMGFALGVSAGIVGALATNALENEYQECNRLQFSIFLANKQTVNFGIITIEREAFEKFIRKTGPYYDLQFP